MTGFFADFTVGGGRFGIEGAIDLIGLGGGMLGIIAGLLLDVVGCIADSGGGGINGIDGYPPVCEDLTDTGVYFGGIIDFAFVSDPGIISGTNGACGILLLAGFIGARCIKPIPRSCSVTAVISGFG